MFSFVVVVSLAMLVASCSGVFGGVGRAACPQMSPNVDALTASYSANAQVNGKIRTFVQASKDVAAVSIRNKQSRAFALGTADVAGAFATSAGLPARATRDRPHGGAP